MLPHTKAAQVLADVINSLEPLAGFHWPAGPHHRNGGGTGSQREATEALGQGGAEVSGSPRKAGCALRPGPGDPVVLSLRLQVHSPEQGAPTPLTAPSSTRES